MPPLEGCDEWTVETGECLLSPGADLDLLDALCTKVPDGFLRNCLGQEKHRIKSPLAERQDALGQMPAEPAQAAVGMPELLKIEHDPGPVSPSLLGDPQRAKPVGEHGETTPRPWMGPTDTGQPTHQRPEVLSAVIARKLNANGRVAVAG